MNNVFITHQPDLRLYFASSVNMIIASLASCIPIIALFSASFMLSLAFI